MEIQKIRVEDQQGGGDARADTRARHVKNQPRRRVAGDRETGDRDERREDAGAIQKIDLRRPELNQVRQRQPHGADLLPSWRQVVEDAARHDKMRSGVVMAQNQAIPKEDNPRSCAGECGGGSKKTGKR